MKLKASLLLNSTLCIHPLPLMTEALHLVATIWCTFCSQYCITLVLLAGTHNVLCYYTKDMPIHFIDGKHHIKQLKSVKHCKTCLTIDSTYILHIIYGLTNHMQSIYNTQYHATQTYRYRHTHTHTHTLILTHTNAQTKAISRNPVCTGHMWLTCTWCLICMYT